MVYIKGVKSGGCSSSISLSLPELVLVFFFSHLQRSSLSTTSIFLLSQISFLKGHDAHKSRFLIEFAQDLSCVMLFNCLKCRSLFQRAFNKSGPYHSFERKATFRFNVE